MTSEKSPGRRLRLAVTRLLPPEVVARLEARHDVWINPDDRTLTPDELQRAAASADALLVTGFDKLDAAAVARLPASVRYFAGGDSSVRGYDYDRGEGYAAEIVREMPLDLFP